MAARRKFICGNWKMYKGKAEARAFFAAFLPLFSVFRGIDVGFAPTFTTLAAAVEGTAGSGILIGAQNVHWAPEGAFTGEVSAAMLKEAGASFAIVGHSERRQYFGETDATVLQRARAATDAGLAAVVCVGETLEERESGGAGAVVARQLAEGVLPLGAGGLDSVVIAYEPVWAIGTGKTASPDDAQEMHRFIRGEVEKSAGAEAARRIRILYGGSVKPGSARELMGMADVDGALVGGASLDAETFASIVRFSV